MPWETILQLGAVAVLFAISIREFFGYLKSRNQGSNTNSSDFNESVLMELQKMNTNHLHSIEKAINDNNVRLVDVIHNDNIKMIELLGEIKGGQK